MQFFALLTLVAPGSMPSATLVHPAHRPTAPKGYKNATGACFSQDAKRVPFHSSGVQMKFSQAISVGILPAIRITNILEYNSLKTIFSFELLVTGE